MYSTIEYILYNTKYISVSIDNQVLNIIQLMETIYHSFTVRYTTLKKYTVQYSVLCYTRCTTSLRVCSHFGLVVTSIGYEP